MRVDQHKIYGSNGNSPVAKPLISYGVMAEIDVLHYPLNSWTVCQLKECLRMHQIVRHWISVRDLQKVKFHVMNTTSCSSA